MAEQQSTSTAFAGVTVERVERGGLGVVPGEVDVFVAHKWR